MKSSSLPVFRPRTLSMTLIPDERLSLTGLLCFFHILDGINHDDDATVGIAFVSSSPTWPYYRAAYAKKLRGVKCKSRTLLHTHTHTHSLPFFFLFSTHLVYHRYSSYASWDAILSSTRVPASAIQHKYPTADVWPEQRQQQCSRPDCVNG